MHSWFTTDAYIHIPFKTILTVYRSDGFVCAELGPSYLDVLVDKTTDDKQMKDDLTTLNPNFLDKFPLTIQKGTLTKEITGGFELGTENE